MCNVYLMYDTYIISLGRGDVLPVHCPTSASTDMARAQIEAIRAVGGSQASGVWHHMTLVETGDRRT